MIKKISPLIANPLIDALANIYWYKNDLKNYLINSVDDRNILIRINWDDNKRVIASTFVNLALQNPELHNQNLINIMCDISSMTDFSHLEKLEDGSLKVKKAKESILILKKVAEQYKKNYEIDDEIIKKIRQDREENINKQNFLMQLNKLKDKYVDLVVSKDLQKRGFELEKIIRELFNLFDLDPKASFKISGEQIDGAFVLDNTDYLLEVKWVEKQIGLKDLDSFRCKVERKLDNTLGLCISINGFVENSVNNNSGSRQLLLLMDGADVLAVLENRISLEELILGKKRCAARTGNIYLKISEII